MLAGLLCTAAVVVFAPESGSPAPDVLSAGALSHPSVVALPPVSGTFPRVRRASRGGLRTALPPLHYVSRTVATGASFSGEASWYGGSFQGRRTADGERFNTYDLTAASKTLPFGTRLRVCRQSRCTVVRINDRGPYVGGRILDLSQAARNALGYDGVAFVTATPVETRKVAVRSAAPHRAARAVVRRPVPALVVASPAPTAAPSPVLAAEQRPVAATPVIGAAALLTLAGGGVAVGRRRRVRSGPAS